jgi:hypothetical protein
VSIKKSAVSEITYVGLDVHKDSISAAVLEPGRETPFVDRFFHDEASLRRFVSTLGDLAAVRACNEAGPTGYELARFLIALESPAVRRSLGPMREVVALST